MYISLIQNTVREIIPDEDPVFPGVPVSQRYPADFADALMHVPDGTPAEHGWVYHPEDGTFAPPVPDLEAAWEARLAELSAACGEAITAGCGVTLSASSGHISLTAEDQINLSAAMTAVEQGAAGYPYHLDGQLCAVFPAEDIRACAQAATAHKLYHTTYYNHLAAWVRRCATLAELEAITYGAALPEDLAANMAAILGGDGSV